MSDEELRAAVERLRRWKNGESPFLIYESIDVDMKFRSDYDMLTSAYLAEHPADDAELVTLDWCRSIGFTQNANGAWRMYLTETAYLMWNGADSVMLSNCQRHFTTRGDVRLLCRALGIALQEKPAPPVINRRRSKVNEPDP